MSSRATDRIERPIATLDSVRVSEVRLASPLPRGRYPHPPECDSLTYLRYRRVDGPERPDDVDAIISLQAGITAGASSLEIAARNLIAALADRGLTVEVWAMERRSYGLTDATGMRAAVEQGDYRVAIDYYYNGKPIDGRTFAGWVPDRDQRFLAEWGVTRTVDDWHEVHVRELPDRTVRAAKLFIGGHSLGGPLSSYYCQTEFPGAAETVGGAGYRQVAGVLGFDGPLGSDPFRVNAVPGVRPITAGAAAAARPALLALLRRGLIPTSVTSRMLPTGAAAILFGIAALAARFEPEAESELPEAIPASLDPFLRVLFPRGLFGRRPAFRDWRLTNEAVLGSINTRVSQPVMVLNLHMGGYDGPVRPKRAYLAALTRLPLLGEFLGGVLSPTPALMPADPTGRLNGWSADAALANPADVALAAGNGRFSFLNCYDTLRNGLDLGFLSAGYRGADLTRLRHADYQDHLPTTTVISQSWLPFQRRGFGHPADAIPAPGYSHTDIISSTQPDIVISTMADFVAANLSQNETKSA
ncbi:hypothetical protein [Nocardia sp. CDC160]|uniref:hypothetical protein n=1 Tax=Nocardia sp. CDC160 TaxID=3112166 RepID=UPI002DBC62C7|nr:hypothetical protein [Nocardia sp. CDC160]MEC3919394.1 hypothetical protein [Nocardia sp. CDC160]